MDYGFVIRKLAPYNGLRTPYNVLRIPYNGLWIPQYEPTKNNSPANQKGYDTFETTVGKLSARRIQICFDYFCLGIILEVILNNFQNIA